MPRDTTCPKENQMARNRRPDPPSPIAKLGPEHPLFEQGITHRWDCPTCRQVVLGTDAEDIRQAVAKHTAAFHRTTPGKDTTA